MDCRTIYQLGDLLDKLGDHNGATKAFGQALSLARKDDDKELILLLFERGYN
jgi:predicted RNA polymerase sigma factor